MPFDTQVRTTGNKVTGRQEADATIRELNRELRLLSIAHQVLIRATSESALLHNICEIVVETGEYRFAWIGVAENDARRSVRPVACAGIEASHLEQLRISWGDTALGRGPTGRAIREQAVHVCHDIAEDVCFAPWRKEVRQRGYGSSIALPLDLGEDRATLNIYSDRVGVFDAAEAELLRELATDVAFGVRALRAHGAHERAEKKIARLARITRLQAAINAAVLRIRDRDELLTEACRLATHVGGYDRAVVSIMDADGRRAWPRFRAGAAEDFPEPDVIEIGDGTDPDTSLTSRALRTGELTVCSDLTKSEPPVAMRERLIELGYQSFVALPLIVDGHRLGVLSLASRDSDLVRDEELLLLQDMTASLSFALRAQEHEDAAQLLAYYDPLTGLAKRAVFCQRLDKLLAQLAGPGENPAVAAFDVHYLSSINDSYGRHFGDLLLQSVAERLKRHAASDERIGYLGGGTFVLVEPDLINSDESIASLLGSTVFDEPFSIEGRTIRATCRSGVARYPLHGTDSDTLVQKAEAALTHAKETGEQYIHYALEIHSEIGERLELEHRLRAAIDEQQFELYYQPQISMKSGRIESVEALLRWRDPERGLVSPAQFLPVLEASGMIVAVGSWVLHRAVQDCRRWADLGLGPVRVAVNVSALQIRRRTFVPHILDLVRIQLGDRPGYGIDLEITETALLQDIEGASRKLEELRAVGVRIALDDFGTGYSSLGLLPRLPVDLIKIDRSFVSGLPADPASATLVSSIIRLASAFGLLTVAEGVETQAQMSALREMSCDQTQGFLHCAPVPIQQIEQLLSQSFGRARA